MPPFLQLVSPDAALRDSYCQLVAEFAERGEPLVPFVLGFERADFDALLARLADCSRGIGIPDGFVPHSTYWLVRNKMDVVGVSNVRHSLTPALRREGGNIGYSIRPSARGKGFGSEILRLSLGRARELGLADVLLTCGKPNVVSAKVIKRNGGVLESEEFLPNRGEIVQRYVIQSAVNRSA
jgi:predicted acetyltransferase